MELYFKNSGTLEPFNGNKMVANMHVTDPGNKALYATNCGPDRSSNYAHVELITTNAWVPRRWPLTEHLARYNLTEPWAL
jgi:hypothetical protein